MGHAKDVVSEAFRICRYLADACHTLLCADSHYRAPGQKCRETGFQKRGAKAVPTGQVKTKTKIIFVFDFGEKPVPTGEKKTKTEKKVFFGLQNENRKRKLAKFSFSFLDETKITYSIHSSPHCTHFCSYQASNVKYHHIKPPTPLCCPPHLSWSVYYAKSVIASAAVGRYKRCDSTQLMLQPQRTEILQRIS